MYIDAILSIIEKNKAKNQSFNLNLFFQYNDIYKFLLIFY